MPSIRCAVLLVCLLANERHLLKLLKSESKKRREEFKKINNQEPKKKNSKGKKQTLQKEKNETTNLNVASVISIRGKKRVESVLDDEILAKIREKNVVGEKILKPSILPVPAVLPLLATVSKNSNCILKQIHGSISCVEAAIQRHYDLEKHLRDIQNKLKLILEGVIRKGPSEMNMDSVTEIVIDEINNKVNHKPSTSSFDPNGEWTLKSCEKDGIKTQELIQGSDVWISKYELKHILTKTVNQTSLARALMVELFTKEALESCSLSGNPPRGIGKTRIQAVRKGLHKKTVDVIIRAARAGCPEDSVAGDDGQCKCVLPCPKLVCQPGQQPVRVREAIPERPGSCCPLYECRNQVPLSWLDDGAGQGSGGSCLDLRGQPREVGERWQDEDEPCMSCRCEPGTGLHCHTPMCRSCSQPEAKLAGECCPRCPPLCPPAPRPCHLRCPMGLDTDPLGCPVCRCRTSQQNEVSECKQLDECGLVCVHGLARDERGCDVCECRSCPSRSDCDIHCPHGYRLDRHGCPSCECEDGCVDEGNTTRTAGSTWSSEPCRSCSCGPNGHILCNETVCSVGCSDPVAPPPGHCCPTCPQVGSEWRGWGTMPVVLIVVLSLLCVLLMVHVVRGRFRARLAPSDAPGDGFVGLPQQYYKCIPVYETPPVLRHADKIDKIGPL